MHILVHPNFALFSISNNLVLLGLQRWFDPASTFFKNKTAIDIKLELRRNETRLVLAVKPDYCHTHHHSRSIYHASFVLYVLLELCLSFQTIRVGTAEKAL